MTTLGAYFFARVFWESVQRVVEKETEVPMVSWEELDRTKKRQLAEGVQNLMDIEVLKPITLNGLYILRSHNYRAAFPSEGTLT